MKQTMRTTKMITMGLFTLCTMGLTQASFAGSKTESPVEFKFIGKIQNRPTFQLTLNNSEAATYFINIKDENNNVLYSEKVNATDANFTRKYGLDVENTDFNLQGYGVTVEVTSAKTHKTEVYKVSSQVTVNENITVAKM